MISVQFRATDDGDEPVAECPDCGKLVGVTDGRGVGLADRDAYDEAVAAGLGVRLVRHRRGRLECEGAERDLRPGDADDDEEDDE